MRARLVVPVLAVTAFLAIAGIASHGRPLAGGRGDGPTATFFDYVFTTFVVVFIALVGLFVAAVVTQRKIGGGLPRRRRQWHLLSSFVAIAGSMLMAVLIYHSGIERRLQRLEQRLHVGTAANGVAGRGAKPGAGVRAARLRWDEVVLVLALFGGAVFVVYAGRAARGTPRAFRTGREDALGVALDESIDDLRAEPDLRRAIIAAYARMEHALARADVPRRPAEAPLEYVERALGTLELSADAIRRLADLFEWAKFSQHEPAPAMRDDAIDALIAVRDELRAPAAVAA